MEEKRTCDFCGRTLTENEGTPIENELLCDECVDDHCITCNHCGETFWREDCVTDDNTYLCRECFNDHYRRCESCDRIIHEDNIC